MCVYCVIKLASEFVPSEYRICFQRVVNISVHFVREKVLDIVSNEMKYSLGSDAETNPVIHDFY